MSRIPPFMLLMLLALSSAQQSAAAETKPAWQIEWEKTIDAAKKESKVVAGVPASAELRKSLEETFAKRFPGVEIEISTARGPTNASKIAAEHAAGVRYYDVLISGSLTPLSLLNAGILEPIEPLLILPEVKEAKRWYGGHIFSDNAKRFLYSFQAYQSENLWHNTQLMKADEFRSFDDLLNPKWKSKIGILDPRSAGSGTSTWAFFYKTKGEEFLRKLAAQELLLSRDQRILGENLAKGRLALTIGLTLLQLGAVHQSQPADQTVAGSQRRQLYQQRQRRIVRGQKLHAPQRDQTLRQLAAQQRRPRNLRQSNGASDAPARCGHQMAGGVRHPGVEGLPERRREPEARKFQ